MKIENKSVEIVIVTPEQARIWLQECAFPKERPIRPEWVSELAALLKSGQWEGGLAKFHHVDGRWLQVDGHHRLLAIIEAGVPAWLIIERTHNSTLEAAQDAYNRTDGGIPRTFAEGMAVAGLSEQIGIKPSLSGKILYAARFIENGYRDAGKMKALRSTEKKLHLIRRWSKEGARFYGAIKGIPASIGVPLKGAGPMAVCLLLLKHQPDDAEAFLRSLAANSGLKKGDPIHSLASFLSNPHTRQRTQAYRARATAMCWNAYRNGGTLLAIRPDEAGDLILLGTPIGDRKGRVDLTLVSSRAA
jgi:hypothetical protein